MQHSNTETSEDVPTTVDSIYIPQPSTIRGFKFSSSDGGIWICHFPFDKLTNKAL